MFMYMSLVDERLKICSERHLAVRGSGLTSQIHIPWPWKRNHCFFVEF